MQAHPLPFVVSLSNHPSAEGPFDKPVLSPTEGLSTSVTGSTQFR